MANRIGKREAQPGPVTMIAGLGNLLLMDDGVGVHAVRELLKAPPSGIEICEVGTALFDVLHRFEQVDRIVAIDAMQAGGSAGTLYVIEAHDVEENGSPMSLHELGLTAALRFTQKKPHVIVLGVEPASIDYGLDLSGPVQAALPRIVEMAKRLAAEWELWQAASSKARHTPASSTAAVCGS
jgi:hydrogenase maturation protease